MKYNKKQLQFLAEVARYMNTYCNGYDWSYNWLAGLHNLAIEYNQEPALVSYITQFNYEDVIGDIRALEQNLLETVANIEWSR